MKFRRRPSGVEYLNQQLPLWDKCIQVLRHVDLGQYHQKSTEVVVTRDQIHSATVMTSEVEGVAGWHRPVLDIDMPAALIPSSTPGHFHLVIDKMMPQQKYFTLLDALAEAGVVEPGYAGASKSKGYSAIRVPWVRK